MKQLFRKLPFFAFALLLSVIACRQDDTVQHSENEQVLQPKFIIQIQHGDHLRDSNPTIFQKLEETSRYTSSLATTENETQDTSFSLDLNTVQIIERNTYTQYTTSVLGHYEQETNLLNYMLLDYDNGTQYQFLIKYPRIITDEGVHLDRANAMMESISGSIILQSEATPRGVAPCLEGTPVLVESSQEYQCTQYACTGLGHALGEECECGGVNSSCSRAYEQCLWVVIDRWACSGGGTSGSGTGGTTGGNTDDPNDAVDEDDAIETVPFVPYWQRVVNCVNNGAMGSFNNSLPLSSNDISWLQTNSGSVFANLITNFIDADGCNNNKSFIDEAVEALQNGGEVDFFNKIIFKIEQDCAEDIAKKIVNNSSQLSQRILLYFNQDKNYIIKYSNLNIDGTAVAATSIEPQCEDGKCTIDILLDNDLLNNATDLLIAKVILHETLHASLNYLFQTGQFTNQGLDPNSSNNPDYKSLVEAYTKYLANNNPKELIGPIQVLEHQYMTIFVEDMINTLKVVGLSMGYDENSLQLSDTYLADLIWSGSLEDTIYFGTNFTFTEQERIHYRGIAELTNSSVSYQIYDENGIPNTIVIQPQSNVINNSNTPCFSN